MIMRRRRRQLCKGSYIIRFLSRSAWLTLQRAGMRDEGVYPNIISLCMHIYPGPCLIKALGARKWDTSRGHPQKQWLKIYLPRAAETPGPDQGSHPRAHQLFFNALCWENISFSEVLFLELKGDRHFTSFTWLLQMAFFLPNQLFSPYTATTIN